MLGQILAFLAVTTSIAFATTSGLFYPGYGNYVNSVPVLGAEIYNNGFYGGRVLSAGCASPAFRATVGVPEVISSCENSIGSPLVSAKILSSSLYGPEYGLGGCSGGVVANAF